MSDFKLRLCKRAFPSGVLHGWRLQAYISTDEKLEVVLRIESVLGFKYSASYVFHFISDPSSTAMKWLAPAFD